MSHQWEYEAEYIQLALDMNRALREGNTVLYEQLEARKHKFDDLMWASKIAHFKELDPYRTVVEALRATANRLGLPFPDLTDLHNKTGDGQFLFGVADGKRTVQIWPMEDRGYYSIEVYDYERSEGGLCYQGHTTSLDESTIVLSRWFVERCSIDGLHTQFAWMSHEPLQLSGSRMTFE